MPDGEHVIGIAAATEAQTALAPRAPQINLVLNWFDEVRRKSK
jgi:hypothetical protein